MKLRWFWHSRVWVPAWRIRAGDWVPVGLFQWKQVQGTSVEWGRYAEIRLSDGTEHTYGYKHEVCRKGEQ